MTDEYEGSECDISVRTCNSVEKLRNREVFVRTAIQFFLLRNEPRNVDFFSADLENTLNRIEQLTAPGGTR